MPDIRTPNDSQRLVIIGRTGSGKSMGALHQLSFRSYTKRPWYIIDFKTDDHIKELIKRGYAEVRKVTDKLERNPGLYVVRPRPDEKDELEALLWAIWDRGKTGVWIDEGLMLDKSKAFRSLLTQGRSKHIPLIVLSQRPVWMDRFTWSESDFFMGFDLSDEEDIKSARKFIRGYAEGQPKGETGLEEFHSYWYDVGRKRTYRLLPVPPREEILATFRNRLKPEVIRSRVGVEHRYI